MRLKVRVLLGTRSDRRRARRLFRNQQIGVRITVRAPFFSPHSLTVRIGGFQPLGARSALAGETNKKVSNLFSTRKLIYAKAP